MKAKTDCSGSHGLHMKFVALLSYSSQVCGKNGWLLGPFIQQCVCVHIDVFLCVICGVRAFHPTTMCVCVHIGVFLCFICGCVHAQACLSMVCVHLCMCVCVYGAADTLSEPISCSIRLVIQRIDLSPHYLGGCMCEDLVLCCIATWQESGRVGGCMWKSKSRWSVLLYSNRYSRELIQSPEENICLS